MTITMLAARNPSTRDATDDDHVIAHSISIRYTGRMASLGAMDAGYLDKAMAGARIVLAAHCHFLMTGRVPDRVTSKSRDFRVVAVTPRHGS
jgi:hypothetical protein